MKIINKIASNLNILFLHGLTILLFLSTESNAEALKEIVEVGSMISDTVKSNGIKYGMDAGIVGVAGYNIIRNLQNVIPITMLALIGMGIWHFSLGQIGGTK